MLPKSYALIALLLLEGIQYFNFHAIDFNDNTLELGLWGLTIYFFYQALRGIEVHLPNYLLNFDEDKIALCMSGTSMCRTTSSSKFNK